MFGEGAFVVSVWESKRVSVNAFYATKGVAHPSATPLRQCITRSFF